MNGIDKIDAAQRADERRQPPRRIVIAGTGSGTGKTTVTLGIMAALQAKGFTVQGFKSGPDYIDPTYHTAVTLRQSRNLDSWMLDRDTVRELFVRGAEDADLAVVEGAMGLFDGRDPLSDEGSTAHIAQTVEAPVVLVVNVQSMARSAAAVVRGFQTFSPNVRIVGVIANKAGSDSHCRLVREAIEQECGIPVIGCLKREDAIEIPERHLGLIPSIERGELKPLFDRLGEIVAAGVDLDLLLELAQCPPLRMETRLFAPPRVKREGAVIAVARDSAFHFYYPEHMELLEAYGARIVYFSPLADEGVPEEANGLYIGGGFPEEFAERLAACEQARTSIRARIEDGIPTLAECGGYMYLTEAIRDTSGRKFPMVGLLPGETAMQKRLAALGYREVRGHRGNFLLGEGEIARGHEFHYSVYVPPKSEGSGEGREAIAGDRDRKEAGKEASTPASGQTKAQRLDRDRGDVPSYAYMATGRLGTKADGWSSRNLVASYVHVHFGSNPQLAERWLEACIRYRQGEK